MEASLCSHGFFGGVSEQFGQASYLALFSPDCLAYWAHFHTVADLAGEEYEDL